MFKPEPDNIKLKFPNSANDLFISGLLNKQLSNTFVCELPYTFVELLGSERILVNYLPDNLRREVGYTLEIKGFTLGNCIAYLKVTAVI